MQTVRRDAHTKQSVSKIKTKAMLQIRRIAFVCISKHSHVKSITSTLLHKAVTALAITGLFVPGSVLVLGLNNKALAAESTYINFQARILQSSGALVPDGTYHIEFKLYDSLSGGTALWTETRNRTTTPCPAAPDVCDRAVVKNGYVSVRLGAVTSFPSSINWDQQLYLSMNIGGTGTNASWDGEMTPRYVVTSVPYAKEAKTAAGITTNNTNATSTNSDAVSITTGNAAGATSNSGAITIDTGTATGTAGTITIGGTNSSGITLGRSGIQTTVAGNILIQGATVNNTLAITNKDYSGSGNSGSIGTAAATVDIYTSATINQTTTGQTLTIPTPTSTTAGRMFYLSNIGTASFTLLGTTINSGTTAALIWAGSAWQFTGADGSGILNQNSTNQTANFRITGTGQANTSFLTPTLDIASAGTLSLGNTTATAITLGKAGITTTNSGALTVSQLLTGSLGATISGADISLNASSNFNTNINTGTSTGTVTIGNNTGNTPIVINSGTGSISIGTGAQARTIDIGTGTAVVQTINIGGTGANVIGIGNTQTGGSVSIGAAMTTGTITIGGTGLQTGTIALGTGTGAQTINLGTGGTGAKTVTLGSTASTSSTTIDSGTGAINIGTGAQARSINIGTGGAAQTVVVGSTNTTSTTTINSGTGNITLQAAGTSTIGVVQIGAGGAGSATPDYFALDVKSTTGDPSGGAEGYMYYNTFDNKFRCYQGSAWVDCIGAGGSNLFTDGGTFTYLTDTAEDFILGGSTVASADFFFDVSAATLYLGTNNTGSGGANGAITLYSSGSGITDPTLSADASGNLTITALQGSASIILRNNLGVGTDGTTNGVITVYSSGAAVADPTIEANATGDLTIQSTAGSVILGDNSGGIQLSLVAQADVFTATKTFTAGSSYSSTDYSFTRTATGGANALSGSVLYVNDASTTSSTNTANILNVNAPAASTGNLIIATTGGSTERFKVTAAGNTSIAGTLAVTGQSDFTASVAYKKGTDYSTTGSQNNVDLGDASLVRLTGATAQTITGILNGRDGRLLTIVNAGANSATISNNSSSSNASNRIITGNGIDLTLASGASISLIYDSASSLWRTVGGSGGGLTTIGTFNSATSYTNGAQLSSANTTLTFGAADATNPGMVSTSTQTFAGAKTFNSQLTVSSGGIAVTGNSTITGTLAVTGASLTLGTASTTSGTLVMNNATNAFTTTLQSSTATSSKTITLPNETGTVCTTGSVCSGYQASGSYATTSLNNIASTNLSAALNVTSGNLALQTTTSGNITATTATTSGLFNVLTGNLKVGAGTPGVTLNGDDAYITGTLEVDGTSQFDGALTVSTGGIAVTGNSTIAGTLGSLTGLSSTGTIAFSGAGNFSIDSSAFDVTTAGVLSGITGYTQTSGNFAMSGTGTFGTGTGAVSLNGATSVTGTNTFSVGTGTSTFAATSDALILSGTPSASATASVIRLGAAIASGSASGTYIGSNPASFGGDFINMQVGGAVRLRVTNTGASTVGNTLTVTTGGIAVTGNSTIAGTLTSLTGLTSSGTITFSGLSTAGIVTNTAAGVLGTVSSVPVANGGTGTSTAFTTGSVVFAGASGVYTQDNANFFWDDTNNRLGLGDATPAAALTVGSGDLFQVSSAGGLLMKDSGNENTLEVVNTNSSHELRVYDTIGTSYMRMYYDSYSTGTAGTGGVSSTTVTGVGTSWTSAMAGGTIKFADGQSRTISSVTSATSLTVSSAVTITAGSAYTITGYNAVFATTSGVLQVGSNSGGDINLELTTLSENINASKTFTAAATYSDNDFIFTRNITGGSQQLGGSVMRIEDLSTTTNTFNPSVLLVNQQSASATGNLILLQTGGATTRFAVSTAGNLTLSGSIDASAAGALNIAPSTATSVVIGGNSSATITNRVANSSTTAFLLETAGGTDLFTLDTTNSRITIGTSDTTGTLLVLDTKTGAGDPTGVNGGMYYNSNAGLFRCYENGAWENCISILTNASTGSQLFNGNTTATYMTGSNITIPTGIGLKAGAQFRWRVAMAKTAAGTASTSIQVRLGANGTTADAIMCNDFTTGTQTGAVDTAVIEITATVRSINATTGSVVCNYNFTRENNNNSGFLNTTKQSAVQIPAVLANLNTSLTTGTAGLSMIANTSNAITVQLVQASLVGI